jgi:hypothetical protein
MIWLAKIPCRHLGSLLLGMVLALGPSEVTSQESVDIMFPAISRLPSTPPVFGILPYELDVPFGAAGIESISGDSIGIQPGLQTFLEPNRPNPFSGSTDIFYPIGSETQVVLKVYDFFYHEVVTLVGETR